MVTVFPKGAGAQSEAVHREMKAKTYFLHAVASQDWKTCSYMF